VPEVPSAAIIEVLGCDLSVRPAGAPTIEALAAFVQGVQRDAGSVTVRFAPEARDTLAAFVEAERRCCAGLGWHMGEGPDVTLRIDAGASALDFLNHVFEE
jgi:hypothetical protein